MVAAEIYLKELIYNLICGIIVALLRNSKFSLIRKKQ
jgi:hypothetical protein